MKRFRCIRPGMKEEPEVVQFDEDPPFAEMFWAGYLNTLIDMGEVTEHDDIATMKREFMAGLRGETE